MYPQSELLINEIGENTIAKGKSKKKASKKKNYLKSPRICVFEKEKTGQMITVYRCQSCPSFVRKNQPKCYSCLTMQIVGKKKVSSAQKFSSFSKNKKKSKTVQKVNKSITKSKTISKRRQEGIRTRCVECGRRTRCQDAICFICKSNQGKSAVKVDDSKQKSHTKLQSINVKPHNENLPARRNTRSLSTSVADTERITERTRSKTPSILHKNNCEHLQYLERSSETEFSSIVSDLEILLSNRQ